MKKLILIMMLGILLINLASALTIVSVDTTPDEIAPGETADIRIGIENDGEEDIEDVSVVLDLIDKPDSILPFAPYDSSSEYSIDEIRDGRTKYAEFELIALSDAQSGIYKIPLTITYYEEGDSESRTKSSLIGVTVNSEPIIGVSVEDGLLLKPQENEIEIMVVNKGLSDVKFLEIEVGTSTYYNILSMEDVYIGDVDSDDFDSAEFKIYFKENTPSTLNLPVTVTYKDVLNNKYTEDYNLKINVYTRKKAIELGLLERGYTSVYAGGIVCLVLVYIIYRKIKKRRKLKKAGEF